jgi:deoxycytidylate deaminase
MTEESGLIKATLGRSILEVVVKQANRSTIETFKTGAVLFDSKSKEIIESGCSHAPLYTWLKDKRSVHAEDDILNKTVHLKEKSGLSVLVYTLGKAGNPTISSKPCSGCAERLYGANIDNVYYLERCNDESWTLNEESPANLIARSKYKRTKYYGA